MANDVVLKSQLCRTSDHETRQGTGAISLVRVLLVIERMTFNGVDERRNERLPADDE